MKNLKEYVEFCLPRLLVENAVVVLEGLLAELKFGLNRDRRREAVAEIQSVLGPLGDGDFLTEVSKSVRLLASPTRALEHARSCVRSCSEEQLAEFAADLGVELEDFGDPELFRNVVLELLGQRLSSKC